MDSNVIWKIVMNVTQIGLGVLIVYIVYLIALFIMREDKLVASDTKNTSNTDNLIIDGYTRSSAVANISFNTINPHVSNYTALHRSYNRVGGAQFTYSFWLFVNSAASGRGAYGDGLKGKDIFLRGDRREYTYQKRSPSQLENGVDEIMEERTDTLIKCPRIRFGDDSNDIVIEFNTQDDIDHRVSMASQVHDNDVTIRHNLMSLMTNRWVLLTVTFEDNVPVNDFENGIIVRFFVNDILYFTHRVTSTLRQNRGNLFLFPGGEIPGCSIANLRYMNYAAGFKEVKRLYEKGRPSHQANLGTIDSGIGAPLYISEYNKLDLYNR